MNIDENNFVKELKYKNFEAMDYLIDFYGPLVKGVTTKILYSLGNDGIIEECMSDIFMAVWTNINKYDEEKGNFKGWIGSVAKFKAIDYYRKYNKEVEVELIDETVTKGESAETEFIRKKVKGILHFGAIKMKLIFQIIL